MNTSLVRNASLALLVLSATAWGQYSDRQYRRTGILNGNQVRTVFGNWGVIGQPGDQGKRGAWKDDNNGYIGDVSPLVGAEVKWQDTIFHSVVTPPTARPTLRRDEDPVTGKPWTWEPLGGYFGPPPNQSVAISNNKGSWPASPGWPDKLNDPTDPGWLGSWNGYFGKRISADLETYFVMDDNNDEHYNVAANNPRGIAFKPDPTNPSRNGLGLEMRVRGLQWAQFVAKDNIFWLYEIKNTGRVSYDRVAFGMIVGTYVGVTATEGIGEFDDDWSFYDVQTNISYTGDFDRNTSRNPRWNQRFPVGMVGYAFLESPGNPFDGLDNDGDADSSAVGRTARQFNSASFNPDTIQVGDRIVLIGDDFSRTLLTVPFADSVRVKTRGLRDSIWIYPGRTIVVEGNVLTDFSNNTFINPNVYDGIDNDFDGIIDENFFLHYRQIKRDLNQVPPVTLIDILRPVRNVNYLTGSGMSPFSMIDEKRNDRNDNDNDWSRDRRGQLRFDREGNLVHDVGRDGLRGTNDFGERDGQPTSGYDGQGNDTNLPGEPSIDKTDVSESDQVGLSSFFYFTPANNLSMFDDENLWRTLSPGFFDVPISIVNNRPQYGQDGDFVYGSGYFPLLAGETERFSIALVYGGGKGGTVENDIVDLLRNKKTVQKIYDANYQFPTPPEKPTLTTVTGNKKVTLYWDNAAAVTDDPVLNLNDFEGYKVYRSTDPNFSDIFTITDGNGTPQGYQPLVQFDLRDSITGFFHATGDLFEAAQGYNIYLGSDNGIQHSYVDSGDVDNGRTYYYAVVAYDRGFDSLQIFPSENTKQISVAVTGEVTHDINVAVVRPNAKAAGYVNPPNGVPLTHNAVYGTGSIIYNVIDETKVNAHRYMVQFLDTQVDGIDNNGNGLIDAADSTEWERYSTSYSVQDLSEYTEQFVSRDTNLVYLNRKNLVPFTISILDPQGGSVQASRYIINPLLGTIRGATPGSLPNASNGKYSISYRYYPVFKSPRMQGTPYLTESKDAEIFDGVQLSFANNWSVTKINLDSLGWNRPPPYNYNIAPLNTEVNNVTFRGYRSPNDYEIQFYNTIVDTSQAAPELFAFNAVPVNFRIFNLTDSAYIRFVFQENNPIPGSIGKISPGDDLLFLERNPLGTYSYAWDMQFLRNSVDTLDSVYQLTTGDKLTIKTTKPFRQGDVFGFTTILPTIQNTLARNQLDRVKVVPNPYVTASSFEPPLPPGRTSGRGQRKIDFIHLPVGSSVKIFTSRGDHVVTLYHEGNIEDGTVSWNLKTKENLDIAFGVYFYVVESPVGNKTGKIAIIK
ncbi:MAG: hypothetical protein HW412_402 [Bacteroidetes bacterium]|nr:hypothetical protein [Bacteroidota bacterium]